MKRIILLFHTIRFLTAGQIIFRLYYGLRKRVRGTRERRSLYFPRGAENGDPGEDEKRGRSLSRVPSIPAYKSIECLEDEPRCKNYRFRFLGIPQTFTLPIEWNFAGHGKLWTYNLSYFDFLLQEDISFETGLGLIHDFLDRLPELRDGLESYPISLRGINWIKFLSSHRIEDARAEKALHAQYRLLEHSLEYHLLGNHLLENGFSLLFAAFYFGDRGFYRKAVRILRRQLAEQTLSDGGHFELSPMYHSIILYRVLDGLNLVMHNSFPSPKPTRGAGDDSVTAPLSEEFNSVKRVEDDLREYLRDYAQRMLDWLEKIMGYGRDGTRSGADTLPLLNDSAPYIAPSPDALFAYARRLGLEWRDKIRYRRDKDLDQMDKGRYRRGKSPGRSSDSGYRKYRGEFYDLLADTGPLGPSYIPGHAHCDMLSFELRVDGAPCIVDTGTSTYEAGERRRYERSTEAHNTVTIDDFEQSELWGAFRAARRAKMRIEDDQKNFLRASARFYTLKKRLHRRSFNATASQLTIFDEVEGEKWSSTAYFHFAPGCIPELSGNELRLQPGGKELIIRFEGAADIRIETYMRAEGFNRLREASRVVVDFHQYLTTLIRMG